MIYREKAAVRLDDFDRNGKMHPAAVLKLLENAACHHMELVAGNVVDTEKAGLTWLLTEWRVRIFRTPDHHDELTVETWATGEAPCLRTVREMRMTDAEGKVVVIAETRFALFDVVKKRVVMVDEAVMAPYQPEDIRLFDDELPRFRLPEDCAEEAPVTVRRSEVDFNGHVHNTAYLDYAMELLPVDAFAKERLTSLRIVFRKSLLYGMEARVKGQKTENGWCIGVLSGDDLYAGIELQTERA